MLGLVLIVVGLGLAWRDVNREENVEIIQNSDKIKGSTNEDLSDTKGESKVVIDIGGEVVKPGVYELVGGSRIIDVLVKAGGLSEEADRDWVEVNLNRAEILGDGQKRKFLVVDNGVFGSNYSPTAKAVRRAGRIY